MSKPKLAAALEGGWTIFIRPPIRAKMMAKAFEYGIKDEVVLIYAAVTIQLVLMQFSRLNEGDQ